MRKSILKFALIGVLLLLSAGIVGAQSLYPLIEEFDSSANYTFTDPSRAYISNGQVIWNLTQTVPNDQYVYRSIPEFQGDVRLTVLGQINGHAGNHHAGIGLGDSYGNGISIAIGYYGTGCSTQGYYIGARGVSLSARENSCQFTGNWLWISRQIPYVAVLTIENGAASLEVEGVGSDFGTVDYTGIFNTLWIGSPGGSNWPGASGTVDYVIVEPLNVNQPPVCSDAVPSTDTLWPPNHEFAPIEVLDVTDPEGDPISIVIDSIFQDEPVDTEGDGSFTPDGQGVGSPIAEVRAERVGSGNGRFYHIGFTADDGNGGTCSGVVLVGVPKSQGKNGAPVDDGPLYDSTSLTP